MAFYRLDALLLQRRCYADADITLQDFLSRRSYTFSKGSAHSCRGARILRGNSQHDILFPPSSTEKLFDWVREH